MRCVVAIRYCIQLYMSLAFLYDPLIQCGPGGLAWFALEYFAMAANRGRAILGSSHSPFEDNISLTTNQWSKELVLGQNNPCCVEA